MKIAFYAPMKSPNHAVPSGDRLMARLLMTALGRIGSDVRLASELRTHFREPDQRRLREFKAKAAREAETFLAASSVPGAWCPDLWFTYHPYYKSPDWIGPAVARELGIPYVTAEASYSQRRASGDWAEWTLDVVDALRAAAVNICLTERDRVGFALLEPPVVIEMMPPFIDVARFRHDVPARANERGGPCRLVTVAMMRPGDKLESYRLLADALAGLGDRDWCLEIVGDGPERMAVEALFAGFPPGQVTLHGQLDANAVAGLLPNCDVFVWPGLGEGFGLAYLEAQAAGLPIAAVDTAGVGAVVAGGRTGVLAPQTTSMSFAKVVASLIDDTDLRRRLALAARRFVIEERSLESATDRLRRIFETHGFMRT